MYSWINYCKSNVPKNPQILIRGKFNEIRSCNKFGEISYDDEPIYVAGFYADSDTIDNQHDPDIDKFMLTNFDAIPAKVKVRYY